jgi:hypothetical protein
VVNAGTLRKVTERTAPSSTATSAVTRPAGTSRRMVVTGSVTSTMPVSTSTVATPMVPWPHIGSSPVTSMNSTPTSASGRVEGWRMAPDMAAWPRGSYIRRVRMWSPCFMNHSRRSAMDEPGMVPTPPVTTRVGMPSVWLSTVWNTRWERMTSVSPPRASSVTRRDGGLCRRADGGGGLLAQR